MDEPRPGAPRTISDSKVEEVVTATLEKMPKNSTHWSTRLMAEQAGLSQSAIVRIWKTFGLQPHRVETFKLLQKIERNIQTHPPTVSRRLGTAFRSVYGIASRQVR